MSELTDPALELWTAFKALQGSNGNSVADALATAFGCDPTEGLFNTMIAVLVRRCDRLVELVEREAELAEDREQIIPAVRTMRAIFAHTALAATWGGHRDSKLTEANFNALRMARAPLRRSHPLKKLTPHERQDLIVKIDEAIALAKEDGLTGTALTGALEAVKLALERFDFFGHDGLEERLKLLFVESKAPAVQEKPRTRTKVLIAIGAVCGALIWSDELVTAVGNHYGRATQAIAWVREQTKLEMLALPAPSTRAESDGAIEAAPPEPQADEEL